MKNVLITHADEPMGRRIVKRLFHDEQIGTIFAVGNGPPPRSFDRFLRDPDPRLLYARIDLAKHRPVTDLFHSARFRAAAIDTAVHLPRHGAAAEESVSVIAGLPQRTAESRLVVHHCLRRATPTGSTRTANSTSSPTCCPRSARGSTAT
jgi:hypothetical protein